MGEHSIEEAYKLSANVDAVLLDSGNLNLKTKELGGTGRVHNWELSKTIREELNILVYLAGDLNRSHVRDVIKFVQPYGVDLSSGVRTNKNLDKVKMKAFFDATRIK